MLFKDALRSIFTERKQKALYTKLAHSFGELITDDSQLWGEKGISWAYTRNVTWWEIF